MAILRFVCVCVCILYIPEMATILHLSSSLTLIKSIKIKVHLDP